MERLSVSLITTVRNEEDSIATLLNSILAQTRRPDEVVVNDCGCTDRTMNIVATYRDRLPLRTTAGGQNIPQGRNTAIRAAHGPLIACTDAGLWLDHHWLQEIVAPLEQGQADLVAGFFHPDPQTPFERVLGAIAYPRLEEVNPDRFLPAGQSMAFTRALWEEVGGFPEDIPYSEDLVFTLRAIENGCRKAFAPDAVVHFRPRSSVVAFYRQYRNYAYGDGLAGLWPRRHAIRYGSYVAGLALLIAGLRWPSLYGVLTLGATTYLFSYYQRLGPVLTELPSSWKIKAALLVPFLRLVGDVAKMIGYPQGLLARRRSRKT